VKLFYTVKIEITFTHPVCGHVLKIEIREWTSRRKIEKLVRKARKKDCPEPHDND